MNSLSKTLLLTTGIVAIGLGSLNAASANSPRSNSPLVDDVTLSAPGINLNHVTLQNTGGNHVSQVQFAPSSSSMNISLEGHVTCAKDKDIDYHSSLAVYGTVARQGNNIVATNVLYEDSYNPTATIWTGLLNGWLTEGGGNAEPFNVPLASVKNGHPAVRFDPVAEFTAAMNQFIQNGGTKLGYLQQDRFVTVNRPISLAGICEEDGVLGGGYETISVPLTIKWDGDQSLTGGIGPLNSQNNLAIPFQVTSASVTPHIEDYVGECPKDLKFDVDIEAVGTGTVEYRLVSEQGAKGPINVMNFNNGGEKTSVFTRQVTLPGGQGPNGQFAINNGQQQGNLNGFLNVPSLVKHGSWRVEIIEPAQMASDESFYSWKCVQPNFDGPGGFQSQNNNPGPGQVGTFQAQPQTGGAPSGLRAAPQQPPRLPRLRAR